MKTCTRTILALGALLSLPANAASIIPVTGGQTTGTGSGYQNITPFFDSQPASVPVVGPTIDPFGASGAFHTNAGRGFYFDFGTSFAGVTIDDVHVGLKNFGHDSIAVGVSYFWSTDLSGLYDPLSGDVPAPDFGIFSFTAATSAKSWQQIYDGAGVIPEHRYYIGAFSGATQVSNRMEEIVFSGVSAVPEPGTAGLLALVVVGVIGGTRRR